jgi:hypothetical protein
MKWGKEDEPKMATIIDILLIEIVQLAILIIEGLIAKQVYHAIQRREEFRKWLVQLKLMSTTFPNQESPTSATSVTGASPSQQMATWLLLQGRTPRPPRILWRKLASATYIASVFTAMFLAVNYLLRPIVNSWALSLVPLCIPVIVMPIPFLLEVKPSTALLILIAGLALGFFALALL